MSVLAETLSGEKRGFICIAGTARVGLLKKTEKMRRTNMLYPRVNEISYRIEGFSGNGSNYRIVRAVLLSEEGTEKWSVTVQRKEDDGKDFMQEIMSRIIGYQEKVHFRVVSASINGGRGDTMSLDFVVEDLTEEKEEDGRKE